jgi:hypothetical protein
MDAERYIVGWLKESNQIDELDPQVAAALSGYRGW